MRKLRRPLYTLLATGALAACSTQGPPRNDAGMIVRRNCGAQTFPVTNTRATPDILMVVDRSTSMNEPADSSQVSKWERLKRFMTGDTTPNMERVGILNQFSQTVNWGLSLFPKTGATPTTCDNNCRVGSSCSCNCTPGELDVPVGLNASTVATALKNDANTPDMDHDFTPTGGTLEALKNINPLNKSDRANYILLVTDGNPTCSESFDKTANAISAFYAKTPRVKTYVVGIGTGTAINPDALSAWAVSGHTDRKAFPKYYPAANPNELELALNQIVGQVADCTYKLMTPPADPTLIIPVIGDTEIASDAANGYTYDASTNSIIFHGASCDKLQKTVKNDMGVENAPKLEITYGCPAEVIQ